MSKTAKGWYCATCKRELMAEDVRSSACKKCENKPESIDYCVKLGTPYYVCGTCGKKGDKPFMCCFKMQKGLGVSEDRARITYECDTCAAKGNYAAEIKHKDDCKPKFGGGLKKVCMKSGKAPHVSDP